MKSELSDLLIISLSHYDEQKSTWYKFINNNNPTFTFDTLIFNDVDQFDYEIMGYYDNNYNIWIWAWVLPEFNETRLELAKTILNYGLNLEPDINSIEHSILKSMIVNSRIRFEDNIELENFLALISYIVKNKILFIYPRKRYIDSKHSDYVTVYYFIMK